MNTTLRFLSSLLVMAPTVAAVGLSNKVQAAVAPESGVRLYTEANYSGTRLQFSPGETYDVSLKPEYQNQISSLHVPEGFVVTLIDNDGEKPHKHTFDAGNHTLAGQHIDNQTDAVIVTEAPNSAFVQVRQILLASPSSLTPISLYHYVPCPQGPFHWPAVPEIVASQTQVCQRTAIA